MTTAASTDIRTLLGEALALVGEALAPIVHAGLRDEGHAGNQWPEKLVLPALSDMSAAKFRAELERRRAAKMGTEDDDALVRSLEPHDLARVMRRNLTCFPVYRTRNRNLGTLLNEVVELRREWAHFDPRAADPALAAMRLGQVYDLLTTLGDEPRARRVQAMIAQVHAVPAPAPAAAAGPVAPTPVTAPTAAAPAVEAASVGWLTPWREVAMPNADVTEGEYRRAEFAADLAQVVAGRARAEYGEPERFFQRTYLTAAMRRLLIHALQRLARGETDPVIQLKTAFGGGKTHTLIALYHLARALAADEPPSEVTDLLRAAGLTPAEIGRPHVAVVVGTALTSAGAIRPVPELGVHTNTLWGEIAYQLGGAEGLLLVADEDQKGLPPGSDKLTRLLEANAPCLILIDEFVAFARPLRGQGRTAAGSFEGNLTFMQQLTEAVKAVPRALVVITIPESQVELGGPAGEEARQHIERAVGRIAIAYEPVTAEDGFEVVRRRLFEALSPEDIARRDQVCQAFWEHYRRHRADFPREASEPAYLERLQHSYPVHPEFFDRLYEDWSTLGNFQRTRGVLRLMAAVIHALWERGDRAPLITPGALPLDDAAVRNELMTYLGEQWSAVIDTDVAGDDCEPKRLDDERPRWGKHQACQRVARAVFLGSTPQKGTLGIEDTSVLLGVCEPGQPVDVFREALTTMRAHLSYLYGSDAGRYWYGVQPNLNRTVAARAEKIGEDDVWRELDGRLKDLVGKSADLGGVHVCPRESGDVDDEMKARLVVLSPRAAYQRGDGGEAQAVALRLLQTRGNAARQYANTLVFLACDADDRDALENDARRYLAWKSVLDDADALNLDTAQRRQAQRSVTDADDGVKAKLLNACRWLLAPYAEASDSGQVRWRALLLSTGQAALTTGDGLAARASGRLRAEEALVTQWSPLHLERLLAQLYFKDGVTHVPLRTLWRDLCTYLYFPRLRDADVLLDTVRQGVVSRDFFGYAQGVRGDGAYIGLVFGRPAPGVYLDADSVLVQREAAAAQLDRERETGPRPSGQPDNGRTASNGGATIIDGPPSSPPATLPRRFHATVELDPLKLSTQARQIADEVVVHLQKQVGTHVRLTLEIEAAGDGFPEDVQHIVTENARTLKFQHASFEED